MKLEIIPITQKTAKEFVTSHHRHHKAPLGSIFQVGLACNGELVGVAIVGRPVARFLDNGQTVEVTRLCISDSVANACSMLYGACWKVAKGLGYSKLITYTLPSEGGVSLKASGWICDGEAGGGSWNCQSRPRIDSAPTDVKWRWSKTVSP